MQFAHYVRKKPLITFLPIRDTGNGVITEVARLEAIEDQETDEFSRLEIQSEPPRGSQRSRFRSISCDTLLRPMVETVGFRIRTSTLSRNSTLGRRSDAREESIPFVGCSPCDCLRSVVSL